MEIGTVNTIDINREMRDSYLDYAMSVIVGRALPDVRDGLKPVHRRVLFAMSELSNDWNKPYKKSARVVGDVIGKYHPHGDSAVYDFDYMYTTNIREPVRADEKHVGRIKRQSPLEKPQIRPALLRRRTDDGAR